MTLASLILLALQASIWLIVFALGLGADLSDLAHVLRRPALLLRSLLATAVIMPLIAIALVKTMSLPYPVAVSLVAISLAPVPPLLPRKQLKAGGRHSYAVGLLVAVSVVSIVWIPVAVELVGPAFGLELAVPPMSIATIVLSSILAPLAAGVAFRKVALAAAEKIEHVVGQVGFFLLVAIALLIVVAKWSEMGALIGNGTLLAFSVFVAVGVVVGHALGGPGQDDRTVLAIASATHHPGVAIAIARMNFPDEPSVAPAVLLYLLTAAVLSIPYIAWRKRVSAASPEANAGTAR
jgi:bile acid:Na+ symporter, BASS family